MITPSFSPTATERVLPKLALDFTTASLDPRVTFTRTTDATHPATYVASTGYITAATNNQARFDYDPVALTCKGLLIEESRSNLTLSSTNISDTAYWIISSASITTGAVTAPDGTATSQKLTEDLTNANHYLAVKTNITVANATTYTLTFYAKPDGSARTSIRARMAFSGGYVTIFNVANGSIFSDDTGNATITAAGNGWYRCKMSITTTATTGNYSLMLVQGTSTISYQGDGTSGIYIWGAQLEAGAFATSYIPTTTTALTRNADVATMTGTNFSDWYNATEGALSCVFNSVGSTNGRVFDLTDGTSSNRIMSYISGAIELTFRVSASGSTQATILNTINAAPAYNNVCIAYKANSFVQAVNGVIAAQISSGSVPTVSLLRFGMDEVGSTTSGVLNGHISKLSYYPQRLTNAEVRAFSK